MIIYFKNILGIHVLREQQQGEVDVRMLVTKSRVTEKMSDLLHRDVCKTDAVTQQEYAKATWVYSIQIKPEIKCEIKYMMVIA